MARYLGIDWSQDQLHVVAASTGRGGVRIERALIWPQPMPLSPAEAVAAGQQLLQRLKEAKIHPAPVLACLGRDRVIIKDIHYPAVPLNEEPAVVRFQAVKELTNPADEVVIDYAPFGTGVPTGERRALVLIARRQLVLALEEMCKAAGMKLEGLTPRPFGITACLERVAGTTVLTPLPEPPGVVAVLAVTQGWAEFCITSPGGLLLTRALTPGAGLVSEIRRNLAVHAGQGQGQPVQALYVTDGPETAALRERLHQTLDLPVHVLDPFSGPGQPDVQIPETRGGFAGIVGLIHLKASRQGLPANLAHPKEPRPTEDPARKRLRFAAGAVAALLLLLVGLATWAVASMHSRVKDQMARNKALDDLLAITNADSDRVKELNNWRDHTTIWLDELYDLTDRFPEPDTYRARVTLVSGDFLPISSRQPKKDEKVFVAKMSLQGLSDDDSIPPLYNMSHFFESDGHYKVAPLSTKAVQQAERGSSFTIQWTIPTIDIEKRPASGYTRTIPEQEKQAATAKGESR